jgi:hypothetical protein
MLRSLPRPGLGLCIALAVAAHAAVFSVGVAGRWHGASSAPPAFAVRLVHVMQTPAAPAEPQYFAGRLTPLRAPQAQPLPPEAIPALALNTPDAQAAPELDPINVHWPDAAVPPGGVSGRVRLQLDANDVVVDVSFEPNLMPAPFEGAVRAAFTDRQVPPPPGKSDRTCVDVRFEPGAEPTWRWADTADCAA